MSDIGATVSDVIEIEGDNTSVATADGSAPVIGTTDTTGAAENGNVTIATNTDTDAIDILELTNANLPGRGNVTDLTTSTILYEALSTAGSNKEITNIVVDTAGDKFYILAYNNSNAFLFFADSGADENITKAEVNLVATINTTAAIAVGDFVDTDFVLG